MRYSIKKPGSILVMSLMLLIPGCDDSMDSLEGPSSGLVSGLVCNDLPTLAAVTQMPTVSPSLIKEGRCVNLRSPAKVSFIRTVMMPGDGRYSQFEYHDKGAVLNLWIQTDKVKSAG